MSIPAGLVNPTQNFHKWQINGSENTAILVEFRDQYNRNIQKMQYWQSIELYYPKLGNQVNLLCTMVAWHKASSMLLLTKTILVCILCII